ncbi:PAS domain S-box protein [Crossiella sp. SN42]|uniref:CheR family methyltransferase n=1 Tax=Crossiella sp. SN42 TaxID=2944808 RepID=UPI00207C521E|nr:CheR family methyltransferase [Crossiella sp. SN42]MCO1577425.1 PAS domain S-box protein [Crossiella sp. SN42]
MTETDPQFEALLVYLKEARGFDFTGYKRSSLVRRVQRRMAQLRLEDYAEYLDQLQVHPEEFTTLFNTILINVTTFFRDTDAWDYLRAEVLPELIAAKDPDSPIRVWSAGCASGEEAYTLAMVLSELLGPEEFRRRVKIYATDVDEEGLAQARHAAYTDREVRDVPPELLERYFEPVGNRYTFGKDLRRSVIFGRNDLVQDAPISRIDLLLCRNTLMYFNAEAQARILARLHFALAETGVLFLGKAEMLLSHSTLFTPIDLKRRVFRKVPRHLPVNSTMYAELPPPPPRAELTGLDLLRDEALANSPVAQIVVNSDGLVAVTNRAAEKLFGVTAKDMGRPFRDLEISYRPVELRRYIEQAQLDRRTVLVADVEYHRAAGELFYLEIQVNPLVDSESGLLGVTLVFHDVTSARRLQDELEHANRQLETAYEELQSTNEELETTNEELQSTVEELETTNEELQSTNEELETMNEELQSTNDELQSINDELRERSGELDAANGFLAAILTSLRSGVAVLNRDLHVQVWNRRAEDLWGLRTEETVGQHFLNLDIGLPVDQIRPTIKQILTGGDSQELELAAVNRRGRAITVRVLCSALRAPGAETTGVILLMEPEEPGPTS